MGKGGYIAVMWKQPQGSETGKVKLGRTSDKLPGPQFGLEPCCLSAHTLLFYWGLGIRLNKSYFLPESGRGRGRVRGRGKGKRRRRRRDINEGLGRCLYNIFSSTIDLQMQI